MLKREILRILAILFISAFFSLSFCSAVFEVQNLFLKIAISNGESTNQSLSVSSSSGDYLRIMAGASWIQMAEKEISLEAGETRRVGVIFNGSQLLPGVYVSNVSIIGEKNFSCIPVVLEVQSKDLFFDVNVDIPPQYTDVYPGDKIIAQISVFDLTTSGGTSKGLGSSSVKMGYEIRSLDGRLLISESEDIAVNGQIMTTKSFSIPESVKKGDYVFSVSSAYKSSVGTSSRLFRVIGPQEVKKEGSGSGDFYSQPYFILFAALLFLIVILLFFSYFLKDRDKMLLELRRYNSWELRHQEALLREQAKILARKGVSRKEISREYREKIKHLRKKHKKRIFEINALRKNKQSSAEMSRKLNEWKKEGYNTFDLEYKMKGLDEKDMRELMAKWKKEGYGRGKA